MTGCLVFNSHSTSRLSDSRYMTIDAERVSGQGSRSTSRSISDCVIGTSDLVLANFPSRNHRKSATAARLRPAIAASRGSLRRCRLQASIAATPAAPSEGPSQCPPPPLRSLPLRSPGLLARCSDADPATPWSLRRPEWAAKPAAALATLPALPAPAVTALSLELALPQSLAPEKSPASSSHPAANRRRQDRARETWDPDRRETARTRQ